MRMPVMFAFHRKHIIHLQHNFLAAFVYVGP